MENLAEKRSDYHSNCPFCGAVTSHENFENMDKYEVVEYDGKNDFRLKVPVKCGFCAKSWNDIYRCVGAELN